MKILHYDENLLIMRPGMGGFFIAFGLIFFIASLGITFFLGTVNHLSCERGQRAQVQCQLTRTLFGVNLESTKFGGLRGARLDSSTDSDGDTTYKVILASIDGEYPLTKYSSSGYRAQREIVDDINAFAQSSRQPQLDVSRGGGREMLFALPFFLVGIATIIGGIQNYFTTWTFDRMQGVIAHRRETVFGIRINDYALRDISNVDISHSRSSKGGTTYRVELWTESGQSIPLTKWYSSGYKNKERAAEVIRAFLDV